MKAETIIARIALYLFYSIPSVVLYVSSFPKLFFMGNAHGAMAMAGFWAMIGFIAAVIMLVNKAFPR